MSSLIELLNTIDHSRDKRKYFADLILKHPELLPELLSICALVEDEISCRATWGLEFLCKNNLNSILPYLDEILQFTPAIYRHPAVRPMAKIFEYLSIDFYKKKSPKIQKHLSTKHREKITEICFDWLITDQKVAAKAYSMTSLYLLGTEFNWVHPELKIVLENSYHSGSAAYKARARMVLEKIK
ncbi:hypothetical protein [Aquimarina muelleri]|uniref:Adenylosuccinate lyase n=1 Tax=Aquimarina muelleri TaxID=279356 RepID=A0A918JXW4_9FLAO|nr:hypothetical protein [Aquimarina muelleri]MCX2763707.1 adenylosuccinate lyase [Aquimarina muelleri]GGX30480.1 hypothetical protein GCM10007384_34520 [Aquimarina muelleri]